ncbi:DUF4926 domain-containing protein [Pelomonas sp. V22]|uniref:DUF4926 domain-containing protein n=1 Tax=Pelomonas sp. V22 TaxID=2822139 RepID=UPI0024A90B22|nr:DUF4926 domain-containing protein [Pelomonas sp. V22]MDI4635938.1 DUF4926 domain-containing protein [Pelomonas sp. V22]
MYCGVVLKVPLPSDEQPVGARGVVVHVHGQGEAYEVEFMTPAGETIDVVTVTEDQLVPSPQIFEEGVDVETQSTHVIQVGG